MKKLLKKEMVLLLQNGFWGNERETGELLTRDWLVFL
jgi:hypothetical protein